MVKLRGEKMKKLFTFIFCCLLVFFGYKYYTNTTDFKLSKIGYSKEEISVINDNIPSKYIDVILQKKYSSELIEYIKNNKINYEEISSYLNNLEDNKDNNNNELDDETLTVFKKEEYFIEDNLDRYLSYLEKNNDLLPKEVITIVNANADFDFYTNIVSADTSKDYLVLVNKFNKLNENYVPSDLEYISSTYGGGRLRKVVVSKFEEMTYDASLIGLSLENVSSYRSYETQQNLYNNYVKSDGVAEADTYSARAGHSEHQTGLAIDINSVEVSFENTDEFKWLKNNAHKYGFILRFPKNKDNITGYTYEPWHYRYVGTEASKYIYENDITFDEYYAFFLK